MKHILTFINEAIVKKPRTTDYDDSIFNNAEKSILEYINSRFWGITPPSHSRPNDKIVYTVGKDAQGFYIDTEGNIIVGRNGNVDTKSALQFFTSNIDKFNKFDKKDCPYFRWRKHEGRISIASEMQNFNSFEGLPETLDVIFIAENTAALSKKIDLCNIKANKLRLYNLGKITLTGTPNIDEITWLGWNGYKPNITFNCNNMHKE